jgi:hypothetical protein
MDYVLWSIHVINKHGELKSNDGFILMQNTGQFDCWGKPIYEGDVVTDGQNVGAVDFSDGMFGLRLGCYHVHLTNNHEVIGNVWEHHNLLEKGTVNDKE